MKPNMVFICHRPNINMLRFTNQTQSKYVCLIEEDWKSKFGHCRPIQINKQINMNVEINK